MIANVRRHSSLPGRCQFSQMPASANGSPPFMPMATAVLHSGLDRPPLKEVVDGDKAPSVAVGVAEAWELRNCFRFRVDRSLSAIGVLTPMTNRTPPKSVKCPLASLRMLPDHPVFLPGSTVLARRQIRGSTRAVILSPSWFGADFWVMRTTHAEKISAGERPSSADGHADRRSVFGSPFRDANRPVQCESSAGDWVD